MPRLIKKLLFAIFLIAMVPRIPVSHAQEASNDPLDLKFTHITTKEGLLSFDVISIAQDKQGFMWFGLTGEGGLLRYDGYELKRYSYDEDDETSLSFDAVWFVFIDQSDTIWVGTIRGGLNRYNRETDNFTRYLHDPEDPTSLPDNDLKAMYQSRDGTYWVGTSLGFSRFDPETGEFFTYYHDPDNPNSISDNSVRAIYEEPETGVLWLGTRRGGLSIFDPQTEQFTNYQPNPDDPTSLSNESVDVIYRDKSGTMWLGTREGLNRFDPATESFIRYYHDPDDPTSLGDNKLTVLFEDSQNRFWIGHGLGVDLFDPQTETFRHHTHDLEDPYSIGSGYPRTIFEDNVGTIWIGTITGGISRLSALPVNFTYYTHDPNDPYSIMGGPVIAVEPAADEGIWILMADTLSYFDGEKFTHYPHDPDNPDGLPGRMASLTLDNQGNLWIGTATGSLSYYDVETQIATHYAIPAPGGVGSVGVREVDGDGNLWLGNEGRGLIRFDGETFTFFQPDEANPDPTDFPDYYFQEAFYDSVDDTLWIGGPGLIKFNPAQENFTTYYYDPADPKSTGDRPRLIRRDSNGILWLTTADGLHSFDPASGSYMDLYEPDKSVFAYLEEDLNGNLWLIANSELIQFDPATRTIVERYNILEEIQDEDLALKPNLLTKSRDGQIIVTGIDEGLISFYPAQLQGNPNEPPVVLSNLLLFNEPVSVNGEDNILSRPLNLTDELVLNYDQTFITLEFAALNYDLPEKNQYAYMLEGFDKEWRTTTAVRRFATYTNIPPGNYTFRVKASNNSGLWNETGLSLPITVTPPWWQTTMAYVLYGLSSVGAVLGLISWRTAAINKRNKALENETKRVSNILNSVPAGLLLVNSEHRIMVANPIAKASLSMLTQAKLGEIVTYLGNQPIEQLLKPPIEGLAHEIVVEDNHHITRYFNVLSQAIVAEGKSEEWVLAFRDITRERSLQETAAAQQRMASVGQFSAGIAHDFNNMLAVILLNVDLMKRTKSLDAASEKTLNRISNQVKNANQLIKQILDYSRQTVLERRAIDLADVVRNQSKLLSQFLSSAFTLTIEVDETEDYSIYGDSVQIQQILMNLVLNARDAMPSGGHIAIRISSIETTEVDKPFEALSPRSWVVLTVEDEGTGIPADILATMFEPFVTTKPIGKGTGLGLAQSLGIIKQHGGHIDVKTEIDQGTSFILYFPKYAGDVANLPSGLDSNKLVMGKGETILLVEDNLNLLDILAESLEEINYVVLKTTDGEKGFKIWKTYKDDIRIVVSDIVMPNMSGIGLFHALTEVGATQPVIFMTGHLLEHEAEIQFKKLREQGQVEWVRKPIDFALLTKMIAKALED